MHLVADVPVASFLSGGLDSSLTTAMAGRRRLRPQDGGTPGNPPDRDQSGRGGHAPRVVNVLDYAMGADELFGGYPVWGDGIPSVVT